jgi:hypothetical protein
MNIEKLPTLAKPSRRRFLSRTAAASALLLAQAMIATRYPRLSRI